MNTEILKQDKNINLQVVSPFIIFFSLALFKNNFLIIKDNFDLFNYDKNFFDIINELAKLILKYPQLQKELNFNISNSSSNDKIIKELINYFIEIDILKKEDCLDFLEAENFSKKIEFKKEFFYKNTYKCYIYKFMGRDTEIFRKYLFSDFLLSLKERKISCQGLADFALKCLNFKTKYKWGQIMEYDKRENCYFTDCSGLIKSYFFGINNLKYDLIFDLNSNMMWEIAKIKGEIKTLPEKKGVCLYMKGHVGIYIGNNEVIESTSNKKFGNGVVKTNINDREWVGWFQYFLLEN